MVPSVLLEKRLRDALPLPVLARIPPGLPSSGRPSGLGWRRSQCPAGVNLAPEFRHFVVVWLLPVRTVLISASWSTVVLTPTEGAKSARDRDGVRLYQAFRIRELGTSEVEEGCSCVADLQSGSLPLGIVLAR